MAKLTGWKIFCAIVVFCALMAAISPAQVTRTTLKNFDQTDGAHPETVLTQGADGYLYGTTSEGGLANGACAAGCGTIFKIGPKGGTLYTLYNFCSQPGCADGTYPMSSLVQAADGNFYGTTQSGGSSKQCSPEGCGTVFKVTPAGQLTTLYTFCVLDNCADGAYPHAGLVQDKSGNLYGTTSDGGVNGIGSGTVFEVTPTGKLKTLYSFCGLPNCADGIQPFAGLVQVANGNFYGETAGTRANSPPFGTIFEMTPSGKLTTLFTFDGSNGASPLGGLIHAVDGDFYGIASAGGSNCGQDGGCGTVFKITPQGELNTLYNFCSQSNCMDGRFPQAPLVQGADGNFYGATATGGAFGGAGTAFEITPKGTLTTLFSFCTLYDCVDGSGPLAGLLQDTNGTFYGTTFYGGKFHPSGSGGYGTIFYFSTGLGPFIKTQPTFANEGATIGIFGQGFNRSSVVQFGGVQATSVKVYDAGLLEAKVPAGALTGPVAVTTNDTTLTSNQQFSVTPQLLNFNPPNGPVGTQVTINGVAFTQATGVGFGDRVPAQFTVNSDTQITATVPSGAKTGHIGVVTKGGTAISAGTFTVN